MKQIIIVLLVIIVFSGCADVQPDNKDGSEKQIEILSAEVKLLQDEVKEQDSLKKVSIKITFVAGYKQGINTGINNCNMSIPNLENMMAADSLKFSKFVDISFPNN